MARNLLPAPLPSRGAFYFGTPLTPCRPQDRYTYIFNGASQTLDHLLLTPGMMPDFSGFDIAHINADYPITPPEGAERALASSPVYGSSDHDPLVLTVRPGGGAWIAGRRADSQYAGGTRRQRRHNDRPHRDRRTRRIPLLRSASRRLQSAFRAARAYHATDVSVRLSGPAARFTAGGRLRWILGGGVSGRGRTGPGYNHRTFRARSVAPMPAPPARYSAYFTDLNPLNRQIFPTHNGKIAAGAPACKRH